MALQLALISTVLAWLAVGAGLTLATASALDKRSPQWVMWAHPLLTIATLVTVWLAVAFWSGASDLFFNSGALVVSLAFIAGAFIYLLREPGLHLPLVVIALHGVVGLTGAILLLIGIV